MAQDGGTGGGAFHGEMDRRREVKAEVRYAVVCPNVTERTKYKRRVLLVCVKGLYCTCPVCSTILVHGCATSISVY